MMEQGDDMEADDDGPGTAIMLAEDKKYYPSAEEVTSPTKHRRSCVASRLNLITDPTVITVIWFHYILMHLYHFHIQDQI